MFATLSSVLQKHGFLFLSQYDIFIQSHASDTHSHTLHIVFSFLPYVLMAWLFLKTEIALLELQAVLPKD